MRNDLIIEDTTLRDGEQTPGIAYDKDTKINIYNALVKAGIKWLEVGIPAMGGEELETVKILKNKGLEDNVTTIAWNRGIKEDIKQSIDLGFKAIHIGLPTSQIHLKNSVNKSKQWVIQQATELIKFAKDRDVFVSISAEDVGRTDISFLQEYASYITEAGADRLRLSDTVGILPPENYANIIKSVQKVSNIDIQCHAHNDYGLAVANTLESIKAGVKYFHVTVNGIGERAGMADLAQMVLLLKNIYGIDLGIDTTKLLELSQLVSFYTKTTLYPWQPIVGENIFSHESGIHANGTLKCGNAFEPFSPELVGRERKIVIGKHSGKHALKYVLEKSGIDVNEEILPNLLNQVRALSIASRSCLSEAQLISLHEELKLNKY